MFKILYDYGYILAVSHARQLHCNFSERNLKNKLQMTSNEWSDTGADFLC